MARHMVLIHKNRLYLQQLSIRGACTSCLTRQCAGQEGNGECASYLLVGAVKQKPLQPPWRKPKAGCLQNWSGNLKFQTKAMLLFSTLRLQHTTPLSSPSLALHSFTPPGLARHCASRNVKTLASRKCGMRLIIRNLPKCLLLLRRSLSFSALAKSCLAGAAFQAPNCVGRAQPTPPLHGEQTLQSWMLLYRRGAAHQSQPHGHQA